MNENASTSRRVLIVSYQFPPAGGSGVQRSLKLAKYLSRANWQVDVICAGHSRHVLCDQSLCDELPRSVRIHRVPGFEPAGASARMGWLSDGMKDRVAWRLESVCRSVLPENELLWAPSALRYACGLIKKSPVDAVITTSPPHSVHCVGMGLASLSCIPWIADLRDPILDNFAFEARGLFAHTYWKWLERAIIEKASRVVTTCPELSALLGERYGASIRTITNGFDLDDMPQAEAPRTDGKLRIAYVGAFYRHQTIEPLLVAMRRLIERRPDVAERVELRVVGSIAASLRHHIREVDRIFLRDDGYRSHQDAIKEMAAADVLLLLTPANAGGRLCIPAKTFEYLRFGKHVLGVVHAGTTLERLLVNAGNSTVVTRHDADSLSEAIEGCYVAWQAGTFQKTRDPSLLNPFSRASIGQDFAKEIVAAAIPSGVVEPQIQAAVQ